MKAFHFSYISEQVGNRPVGPHQLRDGDAFSELLPLLLSFGYAYGGKIINYPAPSQADDNSLLAVRKMKATDLLVLTTRPPLNDRPMVDKRFVRRSRTQLEARVFAALGPHLDSCNRDHVYLTETCAARLKPEYQNRALLDFFTRRLSGSARTEVSYQTGHAYEEGKFAPFDAPRTTAAYLIHTAPIELGRRRGGPRLLVSFAMSGTFALAWAYLLRSQRSTATRGLLRETLKAPTFVMAELVLQQPIPAQPRDLSFADTWQVRLIT